MIRGVVDPVPLPGTLGAKMGTHRGWDASPMQSTILTHLCLGTNKSTEYTYQQVFGKSGKKSENPEETHVEYMENLDSGSHRRPGTHTVPLIRNYRKSLLYFCGLVCGASLSFVVSVTAVLYSALYWTVYTVKWEGERFQTQHSFKA